MLSRSRIQAWKMVRRRRERYENSAKSKRDKEVVIHVFVQLTLIKRRLIYES